MPGQKVLIVDDDPIHLKLTGILLSGKDFEVETAETAEYALEVIRTFQPSLIITDYQLPDFDGLELARRLKANPSTQGIPVVLMTSISQGIDDVIAKQAGCAGFIAKPIRAQTFAEHVLRFLKDTDASTRPFTGAGLLALVVNDDAVERRILQEQLKAQGFNIAVAADGVDGLNQARSLKPAVIVGDILMPKLDGFKMCIAIREENDLQNIPVVLTTSGSIQKNDELMAQSIGANAFVLRTPDMREVMEAVRTSLIEGARNPPRTNPELIESLRRYFLEEGERQTMRLIDQLQSSVNRNALRRLSHRWAGVAATFGYPKISEVARELELLAQRGSLEEKQLRPVLVELSDLFMEAVGRK